MSILYELIFTLLARRTDASLVCMSLICHSNYKIFKIQEVIHQFNFRNEFRPFWQKLVDLRYVHIAYITTAFAELLAHQRFPTCMLLAASVVGHSA